MATRGEVLVLDIHAHIYAEALRQRFPGLKVHVAHDITEVPADVSKVEALICFGIIITDELMRRLGALKWVQSLATGVDHFLRCPTIRPEATITSGRGIHGPSMRETVAYHLLSLSQIARQRHADQQSHHWERRLWSLLAGKMAVLVGIGVAGASIGELLKAFGMTVIGVTSTPRRVAGFDEVVGREHMLAAAGQADYLIGILPNTPENRGYLGRDVFAAMKPSACFINVGRGETMDEPALIEALRAGKIAGAGLDVFAAEPLPKDSPFWDMPNVVMTPHVGGYFVEYEEYIMPLVLENMEHFLAGRTKEMRNIVKR
jgi:D-2-hydroxyacid dehydrogenase (NADP+)